MMRQLNKGSPCPSLYWVSARPWLQGALVDRVVQDFLDTSTPLKQFSEAVLQPAAGAAEREAELERRAAGLVAFSGRVVTTAKLVATGTRGGG